MLFLLSARDLHYPYARLRRDRAELVKMLRRLMRGLHIGQTIPDQGLVVVQCSNGKYEIQRNVNSADYFAGRNVVLVGIPGAFTPTCQREHLPEYVTQTSAFAARGFSVLALAVNDPFVMKEFASVLKGSFSYIADADGSFTRALDAGADFSEDDLGYRTRRFSAVVKNGAITQVYDEHGGDMTDLSRAETVLKAL